MEFMGLDEKHDFQMNWIAELVADTISTSVWAVSAELEIVADSESNTDTTTTLTVTVVDGSIGLTAKVENTITTVGGRTHKKEWYLRVQHQRAG